MAAPIPEAPRGDTAPHPALALLARETRLNRGRVADTVEGRLVEPGCWRVSHDRIVLRPNARFSLGYVRGQGVTLDAREGIDPDEVALWLNGTIYAAVAALNGLMPIHASAVAHGGRVYAFSGAPGAGKSTLAAALGGAGFPLFCDDTLILDISGHGPPVALPGHKRLKLWPEGVVLAGARAGELVSKDYPKLYAEPAGGAVSEPLPLAELIFLEPGDAPQVHALPPGERIGRLQDDHYTTELFEFVARLDRPRRFARMAQIAARVPMSRFERPFEAARFAEGLDHIAHYLRLKDPA